jgi:glycosyltransferase involved in cell wall biosynthesis
MKILQVCSAEQMGGGERHVADLTRALVERGHTLHLAVRERSPLPEALGDLPVTCHRLGLRNALDLISAHQLATLVRRYQIEILHAHVARDYPVCGLAARLAPEVRFFLTRHHFHLLGANPLYRWSLARAERLIAVSKSVATGLQRSFPAFPSRISVLPNWLSPGQLAEAASRSAARERLGITRPLAIGILGQLTPLKRQDLFVAAAQRLIAERLDADAQFLVIGAPGPGDTAYAETLRLRIDASGAGDQIRLLGYVEALPTLFSAFDIIAIPSINEAFSLVLIEAMAGGCAVVASRTGALAEILEDEQTGLLVAPQDLSSLTDALGRLIADAPLRTRLADAARSSARQRFARDPIIDQLEALYLTVSKDPS